MCDTDDHETDLVAYADQALTDRLCIEQRNGHHVPVNRYGHIQNWGLRRAANPGDEPVRVIWKSGKWEVWVAPD